MTILLLKLLLAPLLVTASSLAGRRWGPRIAGILVCLPIVAGPVLLILYLDHGRSFTAAAATSTTLGIVSVAVFAVVFAWVSKRRDWLTSLLASWAAVLVVDAVLMRVHAPALVAMVVALLALHGAGAVLGRFGDSPARRGAMPWWDLPARASATGGLVLVVTGLSDTFGPTVTGILTPFPIAVSVVLAFTAAQSGHGGALAMLKGIVPGLDGFVLFTFTVATAIEPWGPWAAFGTGLAAALAFAMALVWSKARSATLTSSNQSAAEPAASSG